jgi:hypothetical protein
MHGIDALYMLRIMIMRAATSIFENKYSCTCLNRMTLICQWHRIITIVGDDDE